MIAQIADTNYCMLLILLIGLLCGAVTYLLFFEWKSRIPKKRGKSEALMGYEYLATNKPLLLSLVAGLVDAGQSPSQIWEFAKLYAPLHPTLVDQICLAAQHMRDTPDRPVSADRYWH